MVLHELEKAGKLKLPDYIHGGTQYLVVTGSQAYGVATENSDIDLYGFCIPNKSVVFPHLAGEIPGFSTPQKRFDQWSGQVLNYNDEEYDISVYNIVKYFKLCMQCNPNMLDTLFVDQDCIRHMTNIGEHIRENRSVFISKKCWHTHKGYAYSQLNNVLNRKREGKRKQVVDEFGFDVKSAYHTVRLILQVEQLLQEGTLNLRRNSSQLKYIREGGWTKDQVVEFFSSKERELEKLYEESKIPYSMQEDKVGSLLLECLEIYYGNLDNAIKTTKEVSDLVHDIERLLTKYKS